MGLSRLVCAIALFSLLLASMSAQSSAPARGPASEAVHQSREANERKAAALLEEVVLEGRELRLAENRIRVLSTLADLLWPRDESRARALFREVTGELVLQGGNLLVQSIRECGQILAELARGKFDLATTVAGSFQRPEVRAMVRSMIV